jgi:Xaa-Pro dipeptidase
MQKTGLDAVAFNPGPSLTYLAGIHLGIMERPMVLIFTADAKIGLILPDLELLKTKELPFQAEIFPYGDNPATWGNSFKQAAEALNLNGKKIGVEPTHMRVLELRYLEAAAPQAQFIAASEKLAALRIHKEPEEIEQMRKAVDLAQRALVATLPSIRPGVTENEIANELTLQLLHHGLGSGAVFTPIVSGGPNSANPHAMPSDRQLAIGDLLVIDWGANVNGYVSDLTRTFAIGRVDPEFEKIAGVVKQANAAGRTAGRPGIPAGRVDQAARAVILEAGYGAYFTHRTGHGIGIEGHEDPYMFGENNLLLAPGMAYTVEPGIYLPGRGGVRIEDDVVVTESGSETLSNLPRELQVLG